MKIESPSFQNNQPIPKKYACDGEDINPPLVFFDVPPEAKSLVLIVDDPDAPRGTRVHWTLWNIALRTREVSENSVPEGAIQGITDFDRHGYGGPCPPLGTHHYFFKLYALDTILIISSQTKAGDLKEAMSGHILDQAELIGLYSRE